MEEKKEEKQAKNEKKGKHTIIILLAVIAVLFITLIGLVGFMMVSKTEGDEPKNTNNTSTQEEQKEATNQEEQKTKEETPTESKSIITDETENDLNNIVAYFGTRIPLQISDISNNDMLLFVIQDMIRISNKEEVSSENVMNTITRIFGKDSSFYLDNVDCFAKDGLLYEYNKENGTFTFTGTHGHGGAGYGVLAKVFIQEELTEGNKKIIKTKILYNGVCGDLCGPMIGYHSGLPATSENQIYDGEGNCGNQDQCESYDEVYEKVKDKLPITNFIYTKQSDGNYGLAKIEVE